MKKLALILATMMVVAAGCITAQTHRHTDRSNTAAIESIASSNTAALDTIGEADVDTEFGNFVNHHADFGGFSNDDDSDEALAKTAIVAVFGTLAVLFLAPVFIVAIILYFVHKNRKMKNDLAMAAIAKGVPVPGEQTAGETKAPEMASSAAPAPSTNVAPAPVQKTKMENAIRKLALGVGLALGGWFLNVDVLIAVGVGFVIYAIGLICIDQFVDKKNQSTPYNKVEHRDEKPE